MALLVIGIYRTSPIKTTFQGLDSLESSRSHSHLPAASWSTPSSSYIMVIGISDVILSSSAHFESMKTHFNCHPQLSEFLMIFRKCFKSICFFAGFKLCHDSFLFWRSPSPRQRSFVWGKKHYNESQNKVKQKSRGRIDYLFSHAVVYCSKNAVMWWKFWREKLSSFMSQFLRKKSLILKPTIVN